MISFILNSLKCLCMVWIMLLYSTFVQSQSKAPGGISGEEIWYYPGHLANDAYLVNFHTVGMNLNEDDIQDSVISLGGHNEHTIFTVFQQNDGTDEQILWSLIPGFTITDSIPPVILTTHRIADLEKTAYMNFKKPDLGKVTLNTYLHKSHTKPMEDNGGQLLIGKNISNIQVPAAPFGGAVPELIIYPRALSAEQIIQIESYLALKYGISLNQPVFTEYVNSGGNVIWSNKKTPEYSYRITGIGRDDLTGLNQKQSTSATAPGQFVFSAGQIAVTNELNNTKLENGSFLIWSDNNAPISTSPRDVGGFNISNRKWQIQRTGKIHNTPFYSRFRRNDIFMHPEENEIFWLIVDDSGKGDFSPVNVSFFSGIDLKETGYIHFDSLFFDANSNGQDVFSIGTAADFFAYYNLDAPTCGVQNGRVDLKIVGGIGPFNVELKRNDKEIVFEELSMHEDILRINGLNAAQYALTISDRSGKRIINHFTLSHTNGPEIDLEPTYYWNEKEILVLDASHFSHSTDVKYSWTSPEGVKTENSRIRISTPGFYNIQVEDDGCSSIHEMAITSAERNPFRHVHAFPNPTTDEKFYMHLLMEEAAAVKCSVFNSQGQFIEQSTIGSVFDMIVPMQLTGPSGSYIIQLQSGQFSHFLKIIKQ